MPRHSRIWKQSWRHYAGMDAAGSHRVELATGRRNESIVVMDTRVMTDQRPLVVIHADKTNNSRPQRWPRSSLANRCVQQAVRRVRSASTGWDDAAHQRASRLLGANTSVLPDWVTYKTFWERSTELTWLQIANGFVTSVEGQVTHC